MNVINPGR